METVKYERDLLKLVKDYLTLHRILWWRENVMGVKIKRNGKTKFYRSGRPGLPDLFAIHRGRVFALELKAEGKEQSQAQRNFQSDFESHGAPACKYVLVRRIEEVIEALR